MTYNYPLARNSFQFYLLPGTLSNLLHVKLDGFHCRMEYYNNRHSLEHLNFVGRVYSNDVILSRSSSWRFSEAFRDHRQMSLTFIRDVSHTRREEKIVFHQDEKQRKQISQQEVLLLLPLLLPVFHSLLILEQSAVVWLYRIMCKAKGFSECIA